MSGRRMPLSRRFTTSLRPRCEGRRPSRNDTARLQAVLAVSDYRDIRLPEPGEALRFGADAAEAQSSGGCQLSSVENSSLFHCSGTHTAHVSSLCAQRHRTWTKVSEKIMFKFIECAPASCFV